MKYYEMEKVYRYGIMPSPLDCVGLVALYFVDGATITSGQPSERGLYANNK